MSVVVNIVSAVMKSVVGDKIGNELVNEVIGVSIDGISEKGIDKVSDFINGEKAKIKHILSKENMESLNISEENIDYVIAEIKDLLSKIEITDEVLRQCKYDRMNLSVFLWNEYCKCKNDHIDCENDIKKTLFAVSEALIKLVRESEDFEKDVLIHISNSVDDIRSEEQTNSQNIMKRFDELEESNQAIFNKISENSSLQDKSGEQKKEKGDTQKYTDKLNENKIETQEKLLYNLQTICIGCNKKWMDSVFGIPVFANTDGTTNEEVYITDIAIIRAFFKIDGNSCVMFFITQTTEKTIPFMPTLRNTYYNKMRKEKELGSLLYDEIKNSNQQLFIAYGFFTNGSGRTFYGEGYHSYCGYYNDIYYASLDYGTNAPWNMMGYIEYPDYLEEEISFYDKLDVNNGINRYKKFLSHRKEHYPNTYGVSLLNSDYTFNKLMDYNTFDSIQVAYR